MKVNELTNLWVATNTEEDFKILIVALDREEAMDVAIDYFVDAGMAYFPESIEITPFKDVNTNFDCDYVAM